MPQARPAPTRGLLRLPGKLPPSLPRVAWLRATPTRSRCPSTYGIARTPPPSERPKAPAKAAARAPPDPLRHPRPTASPSLHHGHFHHHHHHCSPSADSFLRLGCPSLLSR